MRFSATQSRCFERKRTYSTVDLVSSRPKSIFDSEQLSTSADGVRVDCAPFAANGRQAIAQYSRIKTVDLPNQATDQPHLRQRMATTLVMQF
jgi:hypothetical protein